MDPLDVLYLIRKRGWSLAQIARDAGVSPQILSVALRKPCIGGEKAILDFLKVPGHEIWSDRYAKNGQRLVRRGRGPQRGRAS